MKKYIVLILMLISVSCFSQNNNNGGSYYDIQELIADSINVTTAKLQFVIKAENINGQATGNTSFVNVIGFDATSHYVITGGCLLGTTIVGTIITLAQFSAGTNSTAFTNILANVLATGITITGNVATNVFVFLNASVNTGTPTLKVNVAGTGATTQTYTIYLWRVKLY